ncbi:MAG: LysM peptidoglycan-binding domain-containing protein [Flavobacterium sp.]|nr:MAG: LysM peptidoglycan-binding domain-containing protein [Flavobacterium sp.]
MNRTLLLFLVLLSFRSLAQVDVVTPDTAALSQLPVVKEIPFSSFNLTSKQRLDSIVNIVPLPYNEYVQHYIDIFTGSKSMIANMLSRSTYYFPIFEKALKAYNIPDEIKYLPIIESKMDPMAVSRHGATGLWQFMYQTGKEYNLHIDSFVDERSDPLKSSRAASQYMTNMYRIFGDWELVLASYNSGAGNVAKAIRRSGGQQNYWNIRKHLPKETQGYVPAFLATMYIYEYHKEHGIKPNRALIKHFETDTVMIKREMSFKQIADLLDIPVSQIQLMNPSYKMNVVPFYPKKSHYLRLPKDKIAVFTSNEDKIYAYVEHQSKKIEMPYFVSNTRLVSNDTLPKTTVKTKYHTVKKGESLGLVSSKYGVAVSDLKRWNNLKSNNIQSGARLKIQMNSIPEKVVAPKEVPQIVEKEETVVASTENTTLESTSDKEIVVYTVQKGDNLSSIARKFNLTVAELKELNNIEDTNIKLDSKLKVGKSNAVAEVEIEKEIILEKKDFVNYTVVKGDNLGNIAKRYNVSVASLQEWNELKDNNVQIGKQLLILSDTKPTTISKSENVAHYLVKKGDSLFKIAQKYPGVTVADIKKWNGINGNELKPGMKLKISS